MGQVNKSKSQRVRSRPEMMLKFVGGWYELKKFCGSAIHIKGDERILGSSDFVE